jgi:hypothetical protein
MVGLVIAQARHTAKIGAKKGYFKGCFKPKQSLREQYSLSVPVIYFHITTWFEWELAATDAASPSGSTASTTSGEVSLIV